MSRNCPNCGAPLDNNYCKCPYCGTLYYDLTMFEDGVPCYVKFRTPMGVLTSLAIPNISEINVYSDQVYYTNILGDVFDSKVTSKSCDINVTFHAIEDPENKSLFKLEVNRHE